MSGQTTGISKGLFVTALIAILCLSVATSYGVLTVIGPTGEQGPTGATGATGPAGPAGADGAMWLSGSGVPASGLGNDGDYYLDTANSDVYNKVSGAWTNISNIQGVTGPQGPTGPQGLTGATGPAGPAGADGAMWLSGSGVPASSLGNDGDYYLNTANSDVYNKASGSWSVVANIKGETGATGYVMENQYSSWTGTLTGWSTIVSLTTPSLPTGYYKVELDAHSYQEFPSRLGIGIGVDAAASDATTTRYWQCDSSPFVSGSTFLAGVHTQEVYYLTAGSHTFYFRAGETSGGGGYCGLQNSHITVTFFPDGSVG